jgi:hypothetical protein
MPFMDVMCWFTTQVARAAMHMSRAPRECIPKWLKYYDIQTFQHRVRWRNGLNMHQYPVLHFKVVKHYVIALYLISLFTLEKSRTWVMRGSEFDTRGC